MLTWLGVNVLCFRIDPGWDKFGADYSNWGFMNLRKRDSGEIHRRCQFSYSELLWKIIHILLYSELKWSEGRTQHTRCRPFTVKKCRSVGSFDIVYIIDLPDQYKFNSWTCKCSKAFYLQCFHPNGIVQTLQKVSKCGSLRCTIWKVVSDRNISFVVLCEAESIGLQRWWTDGFSYLGFHLFMRIDFKLTT